MIDYISVVETNFLPYVLFELNVIHLTVGLIVSSERTLVNLVHSLTYLETHKEYTFRCLTAIVSCYQIYSGGFVKCGRVCTRRLSASSSMYFTLNVPHLHRVFYRFCQFKQGYSTRTVSYIWKTIDKDRILDLKVLIIFQNTWSVSESEVVIFNP